MNAGKWWTLTLVSIGTFMLLLDVTVVNVALPDIQRDLDAGFDELAWVVDAYALSLAATILVSGSLADRLGHRRVFVFGLGVFSASSLAAGVATDPTSLNVFRGVQGIGGAAMLATSLALIAAAYSGRDRRIAIGVWGAVTGASVAIGPLVGGALTDGLSWEWVFFVNVPVGIGAAALALTRVPESAGLVREGPTDWGGLVTMAGSMTLLVLALFQGNDEGWGSSTIVSMFVGSALLLAAFVAIERRASRPLLDLELFRKPTTSAASVAVFAVAAAAFAMLLFITLWLQGVLLLDPFEAGLTLLPITIPSFFVAGAAGRALGTVPLRVLLGTGLLLTGAGLLWMRALETGSEWTAILGGGIVVGIGIGLINPTVAGAAIGTVRAAKSGMASGLNSTFRLVGVATGIAALGAVFEARVASRFAELSPASPPEAGEAVAAGGIVPALENAPEPVRQASVAAAERAFVDGFDEILLIAAIVAFAGALVAAALARDGDLLPEEEQLEAGTAPAQAGAGEAGAPAPAAR